jgi:hypothetical protein
MNKIFISLISTMFAVTVMSSCSNRTPGFIQVEPVQAVVSTLNTIEMPEFNKRKLAKTAIPTNSINEQKNKQTKLHTFYFKSYSNGSTSYAASDNNEHMKMLNKAAASIGLKVDANTDGKVTLEEIIRLVTTEAYIKYFRETYITFSFNKLDISADKKLSVDEFNQFNIKIKAKEVPDFQLLEEFAEYDYNSSRGLDIEEYEDFFMKYLLIKVGAGS